MRRLDEAIHEEHDSAARKRGLETEIVRLRSEIELVGSPVGVFPAIVILALYSVVGVVLPVVVMAATRKRSRHGRSGCSPPYSLVASQRCSATCSGT